MGNTQSVLPAPSVHDDERLQQQHLCRLPLPRTWVCVQI